MERFEIELYYDEKQQCYCMMGLSHKDLEDAGIEPQRRSWVNADYVEHLEAKIDKLEQEKGQLIEALELYAKPESWVQESDGNWYGVITHEDISSVKHKVHEEEWGEPFADVGGKKARQVLAKIKSEDKNA